MSNRMDFPYRAEWHSAKGYNAPGEIVDVVAWSAKHGKFEIVSHEGGESFGYWVTPDELGQEQPKL